MGGNRRRGETERVGHGLYPHQHAQRLPHRPNHLCSEGARLLGSQERREIDHDGPKRYKPNLAPKTEPPARSSAAGHCSGQGSNSSLEIVPCDQSACHETRLGFSPRGGLLRCPFSRCLIPHPFCPVVLRVPRGGFIVETGSAHPLIPHSPRVKAGKIRRGNPEGWPQTSASIWSAPSVSSRRTAPRTLFRRISPF